MMNFEDILFSKPCMSCNTPTNDIVTDILKCSECEKIVHCKCLKRGSVPGGLSGDVFFTFTCQDCSPMGNENFVREKMSWLQVIVLVLYHMQTKSSGLARKGFFHWKIHIAAFINKYWEVLFRKDFKRKKKWTGTVAGTLSHFNPQFFQSGTSIFGEQGWWTLTYPKLTPFIITYLNSKLMMKKQNLRDVNNRVSDDELLKELFFEERNIITEDLLITATTLSLNLDNGDSANTYLNSISAKKNTIKTSKVTTTKKRSLLPTLENYSESSAQKFLKLSNPTKKLQNDLTNTMLNKTHNSSSDKNEKIALGNTKKDPKEEKKMLDRFCHYHTSLKQIASKKGVQLSLKIMGGVREEHIYSPYSAMHLKPYIRRDTTSFPQWLKLMAEIQLKANQNNPNYVLPPRASIDYVYLQPEHLPAINSLCNHFFWPGIDLTECLQYPDFSCVVLYRKLIIGFAFLVPNVKLNESYLSFIFTRPGWRNIGIGKFMIYHLIQTSMGKDITLHVSINNSALFLYQKFGFKVEHVELDFYDKYVRTDTKESKHAFFCRLER